MTTGNTRFHAVGGDAKRDLAGGNAAAAASKRTAEIE